MGADAACVGLPLMFFRRWFRSRVTQTPAEIGAEWDAPGWTRQAAERPTWSGPEGAVLTLDGVASLDVPVSDNESLHSYFTAFSDASGAEFVEARTFDGWAGRGIYKRREGFAYIYTGMLVMPFEQRTLVWTMVAGKRGITGVREALISSQLFEQGRLVFEDDGNVRVVERDAPDGGDGAPLSAFCDREEFDALVPTHPLSILRRELQAVVEHAVIHEQHVGARVRG
jgi:hypothetical protein